MFFTFIMLKWHINQQECRPVFGKKVSGRLLSMWESIVKMRGVLQWDAVWPVLISLEYSLFSFSSVSLTQRLSNAFYCVAECPKARDGSQLFSCPSPDQYGVYQCIDDHDLCDRKVHCPNGEDEDPTVCMYHRVVSVFVLYITKKYCV